MFGRIWAVSAVGIQCLCIHAMVVAGPSVAKTGSCGHFVAKLEAARLQDAVSFRARQVGRGAVVEGFPIHMTSNPIMPLLWLTSPDRGTSYTVIKKGDRGFGFSNAQTARFQLFGEGPDEGVILRSLDFSGDYNHLLATLVMTDSATQKSAAVLKLANIRDGHTGEIELARHGGLEIQDLTNTHEHLIVSPRPGTTEYWITDGANRITIVEVDVDQGLRIKMSIALSENHVKAISKVQFFEHGHAGYVRLQRSSGEWVLVPFTFVAPEVEAKPKAKSRSKPAATKSRAPEPQFSLQLGDAYVIQEGFVRTAVHPEEPIIVIAYRDRLEAIGLNVESREITKVLDQKLTFLTPDQEVMGIDFYWNGRMRKIKDDNGKTRASYQGHVEAALLIRNKQAQTTSLYWIDLHKKR